MMRAVSFAAWRVLHDRHDEPRAEVQVVDVAAGLRGALAGVVDHVLEGLARCPDRLVDAVEQLAAHFERPRPAHRAELDRQVLLDGPCQGPQAGVVEELALCVTAPVSRSLRITSRASMTRESGFIPVVSMPCWGSIGAWSKSWMARSCWPFSLKAVPRLLKAMTRLFFGSLPELDHRRAAADLEVERNTARLGSHAPRQGLRLLRLRHVETWPLRRAQRHRIVRYEAS